MEIYYRPLISGGILLFMILWEFFLPRRPLLSKRSYRWRVNLSLAVLNYIILKLIKFDLAYSSSLWVTEKHWGILNIFEFNQFTKLLLTVVTLDLLIYFQHRVFHKIPLLWQLHQVHHSDTDFDTTTAIRFHPLEIILSMLLKITFICLIGADPLGVIIFEITLNGGALFNHANIFIPKNWDRTVRLLIVTPDMHRIHHSSFSIETNSNYGFSTSLWDRIFRTYTDQPKNSHILMKIGLDYLPSPLQFNLNKIILLPFKKRKRQMDQTNLK